MEKWDGESSWCRAWLEPLLLSSLLLLPEHWSKSWRWGLLPAWNDVSSPATLRPFLFFLPLQLLLNEQ